MDKILSVEAGRARTCLGDTRGDKRGAGKARQKYPQEKKNFTKTVKCYERRQLRLDKTL